MLAQVDIEGGLEEAWADVVTFAPKLLGFFVILLIGFFIAKALSKVANALLERVGFDALVERGAMKQAFERSKTEASDVIGVIVFWLVFLVALQLAFGIWGPNPISDLLEGLIGYLPNVIVAVVILVIAAVLAKVLTEVLEPTLGAVRGGSVIAKGAGIAVLVVGLFAALDQLRGRARHRQRVCSTRCSSWSSARRSSPSASVASRSRASTWNDGPRAPSPRCRT